MRRTRKKDRFQSQKMEKQINATQLGLTSNSFTPHQKRHSGSRIPYVMFISLMVIHRSHVQASASYFEFEEDEQKPSPFDVKEPGPQIHHFTHDHGIAGSVLAKSVTFRAPDVDGDEDYIEKRLRRLVSFDFDLIFPPYDDVFEHLIASVENDGMESPDTKNEHDENLIGKIDELSSLSEVTMPEHTDSCTGETDGNHAGVEESETLHFVTEDENAALITKDIRDGIKTANNDEHEQHIVPEITNIDALEENVEKDNQRVVHEEIAVDSVHLEGSVLHVHDKHLNDNFDRSKEETIISEHENLADNVDENVDFDDNVDVKDPDVNILEEHGTNEGTKSDQVGDAEMYKGDSDDNKSHTEIRDSEENMEDLKRDDDPTPLGDAEVQLGGTSELEDSAFIESSEAGSKEKSDQLLEGFKVDRHEKDQNISFSSIEDDLVSEDDQKVTGGDKKRSVGESELEYPVESESKDNYQIDKDGDYEAVHVDDEVIATSNSQIVEYESFVKEEEEAEQEERESFDARGDDGRHQTDEDTDASSTKEDKSDGKTITHDFSDVGKIFIGGIEKLNENTEGIQIPESLKSEENYEENDDLTENVAEETHLHENEYNGGPVISDSSNSLLEETEEQVEETHVLPIKQTSVNEEFVSGLDDLDKFMEEVDPPDELDVGAGGKSIQEIIMGQGAQIIKTRVRKGLHQLKKIQRQTKDRIDDTKKVLDERVEHALIAIKDSKSEGGNLRKAIILVVHKIIYQVKELMDDLGINFDGNNGNDEDQYSPIVIDDDEIAEMRRKVMERRAVQQEQVTARQSF